MPSLVSVFGGAVEVPVEPELELDGFSEPDAIMAWARSRSDVEASGCCAIAANAACWSSASGSVSRPSACDRLMTFGPRTTKNTSPPLTGSMPKALRASLSFMAPFRNWLRVLVCCALGSMPADGIVSVNVRSSPAPSACRNSFMTPDSMRIRGDSPVLNRLLVIISMLPLPPARPRPPDVSPNSLGGMPNAAARLSWYCL